MTLTVLSDDQVKSILEDLTVDELDEFRAVLSSALNEFSTNTQADLAGLYQQPDSTSTYHASTKTTTLYMPSCGPEGMGCKVVSLANTGATADGPSATPAGVVNLFSPDGQPTALIQASTLTAFRTALASACLVSRRRHVRTITVFGAGNQAYWHVRLALMMRGKGVLNVNIINHRFSDTAALFMQRFVKVDKNVRQREGWDACKFNVLTPAFHDFDRLLTENVLDADVIYCCTPSRIELFDGGILTSHEGRRRGRLIVAVGSFTPEMRELPEALLRQATKHHDRAHRHFHKHAEEGGVVVVDTLEGALKESGEIIHAKIGPGQLVELGELVMLHRLAIEDSETNTIHSRTSTSTFDSDKLDFGNTAMSSVFSSEADKSSRSSSPNRSPSSPKLSFSLPFRKSSTHSSDLDKKKKEEDSLARWLRDGTVVYKSVGLGLMDLVVGAHLVKVATEKGVGTKVHDF